MRKIYVVRMEQDMYVWYDDNAYTDKEMAEARLTELKQQGSAWYYDIEELNLCE